MTWKHIQNSTEDGRLDIITMLILTLPFWGRAVAILRLSYIRLHYICVLGKNNTNFTIFHVYVYKSKPEYVRVQLAVNSKPVWSVLMYLWIWETSICGVVIPDIVMLAMFLVYDPKLLLIKQIKRILVPISLGNKRNQTDMRLFTKTFEPVGAYMNSVNCITVDGSHGVLNGLVQGVWNIADVTHEEPPLVFTSDKLYVNFPEDHVPC